MQAAMQVNDVSAARALVEVVDVLGDKREARDVAGQFGNGHVRRVRLGLQHLHPTPLIPTPDQRRIGLEGFGRCQRCRVETLP